ncbi:nuclear transport factor 2 family protein [Leekyejoonella antrihumi]|uniref:Nuclear transport factor 2 family protein n=1 Tax=Leekyejoonella antrihumi TaxID=1660198 RepID=A0A563DR99_9MICO|nr:nuclear transport factor 2 family protein [Leekyejoonella antrihumi]TWP32214.1 nuclear transport factor 2 family protein [Leekyejoonella antrihumi]
METEAVVTNLIQLFDRWERVWHEGELDLVADCVGPTYCRHDEGGDRIVSRDAYVAEIAAAQKARPNTRFVIYDHAFTGDRAWFRMTLTWTDLESAEPRTRAGFQSYRINDGKLAETWLMLHAIGTDWNDEVAQDHWTSVPPRTGH